jgi:putative protein-disulfide isomerase
MLQILAEQLGLNAETFRNDIASSDTEAELERQISFARASGVSAFPSLALETSGQLVPIKVDYKNYEASLQQIQQQLV